MYMYMYVLMGKECYKGQVSFQSLTFLRTSIIECTTVTLVGLEKCLTIHFPHRLHEVVRVLETDKSVPFGLLGPLISNHSRFLEGGVLGKCSR